MPTALEARIALHNPGQITWPEPELRRNCAQCGHYRPEGARGKGRCALVKAMHKVDGNQFVGAEAVACPQFKPV